MIYGNESHIEDRAIYRLLDGVGFGNKFHWEKWEVRYAAKES